MPTDPPPLPRLALSPAQVQQELNDARVAVKKIRRAVWVASADAWMLGLFGALSFICGLFDGASGVVIGLLLCAFAYVEFTGAARLRRLEPLATRRLGYNQLALAGVLIAYAVWKLCDGSAMGGMMSELKSQGVDLGAGGKQFEDMGRQINNAIYIIVIGVAVVAQGGTALYYFSRENYLRRYIQSTPTWIIEMQKAGGPL